MFHPVHKICFRKSTILLYSWRNHIQNINIGPLSPNIKLWDRWKFYKWSPSFFKIVHTEVFSIPILADMRRILVIGSYVIIFKTASSSSTSKITPWSLWRRTKPNSPRYLWIVMNLIEWSVSKNKSSWILDPVLLHCRSSVADINAVYKMHISNVIE